MMDYINGYISENPIISGIIYFLIAFMLLAWRIYKKDSFRMKDYSIFTWKSLVNSWGLIFMLVIGGIYLIIRNV
jgi:hypothetical protein